MTAREHRQYKASRAPFTCAAIPSAKRHTIDARPFALAVALSVLTTILAALVHFLGGAL